MSSEQSLRNLRLMDRWIAEQNEKELRRVTAKLAHTMPIDLLITVSKKILQRMKADIRREAESN